MGTTGPQRLRAVITADVVGSRRLSRFREVRDKKLKRISALHRKARMILSRYTVTTWDEFQTIASDPLHVPRLIFDLRRLSRPLSLRIAVGIGAITEPIQGPINVFSGGQAFEFAREAMNILKSGKGRKFRKSTYFRSVNQTLDGVANLVYGLHDSLTERVSEKQWETINAHVSGKNQEAAARRLGVDKSTVSRNLQRGGYWQMEATVRGLQDLLGVMLHRNVQQQKSGR